MPDFLKRNLWFLLALGAVGAVYFLGVLTLRYSDYLLRYKF